jgi:hypothetical protein
MKIYDEVWIMENNKPVLKHIWGIKEVGVLTQREDGDGYHYLVDETKTEVIYELIVVSDFKRKFKTNIALNGSNVTTIKSKYVFPTKDELIKSLY